MDVMGRLRALIARIEGDAGPDAFDRPDLRRRVVQAIIDTRQRGAKGADTLPPAIDIIIRTDEQHAGAVRRFIDDPEFDAEIEGELLNRLVNAGPDSLPIRHYTVEAGQPAGVWVREATDRTVARLVIEGGDQDGKVIEIRATAQDLRMGRGQRHGSGTAEANDIVIVSGGAKRYRFVSRRAAVLRRAGSAFEVEALDQEDALVVVKSNHRQVRPYNTARQRVRVDFGDRIEFTDGEGRKKVVLRLERPEHR